MTTDTTTDPTTDTTSEPPVDDPPPAGDDTTADGDEHTNAGSDGDGGEPDTFDRAYVEELRGEAAEHRRARRDAEQQVQRLRERLDARTLADALDGVLVDPGDLTRFDVDLDGLRDDDGLLDADRVAEAGRALARTRAHLAPPRPRGLRPNTGPMPAPGGDTGASFGELLKDHAI